jgi:hypothetical protein
MRRVLFFLIPVALSAAAASGAAAPARKPAPSPTPAKVSLKLKWSTASEVDNYGYFVLRGETKEGPFKQQNEKAIPGAGTVDTPTTYEYEDKDVQSGQTYYYYLESISVHGVREKFSPVLSRVCCNQPGTAKQEDGGPHAAPAPSPVPGISPTPTTPN